MLVVSVEGFWVSVAFVLRAGTRRRRGSRSSSSFTFGMKGGEGGGEISLRGDRASETAHWRRRVLSKVGTGAGADAVLSPAAAGSGSGNLRSDIHPSATHLEPNEVESSSPHTET